MNVISTIKAVIFDFDDVLLRVYEKAIRNFQHTAQALGIRVPDYAEIAVIWDLPWSYQVNALWPELDFEQFRKMYHSLSTDPFPMVDGAVDSIEFVVRRYTTGILTSRRRETLAYRAGQVGMDLSVINFIFCEEDIEHKKPDPRAFEKVITELDKRDISRNETIYVGN